MGEERVTHVFIIRNRPVGFQPGRWGGALVAIERGEFPVSCTGYRSLACEQKRSASSVSADFLEELARQQDRERQDLLQRLHEAQKPAGDPIRNYIHASGAYEKAVHDGLFAADSDRASLWAGAHRLLGLVDMDQRFQPAPDRTYPAWTAEHCAVSLVRARELRGLLLRLAAGDFPVEFPVRCPGGHTYLALPPKPRGEPKIDLGSYTAEMALNLPTATPAERKAPRAPGRRTPDCAEPEMQLGLFEPGPTRAPTVRTVSPRTPRPRIAI